MKQVLLALTIGWFLVFSLTGCATPPLPTPSVARAEVVQSEKPRLSAPNVPPEDLTELVSGNTAFALDLYRLLGADTTKNLFYSPYSISIALAMTYAGARGETARQMANALHFTLPPERLHPALNALDQSLTSLNQAIQGSGESTPFRLHVANALWGQQGFEFLSEFLDLLAQNYGAGLRLVDFSQDAEAARQTINQWVSEETEGKIQDLVPPGALGPLTRLVLTNAIYFNAAWRYPFEQEATSEAPFTLLNGEKINVPMMKLNKSLLYAEGEGYQLVFLPYHGEAVEMVVILPAEGQFEVLQANFTPAWLNQVLAARQYRTVELSFPKFQFTADFNLADTLKGLGMPLAFDPDQADFSGMTGEPGLYIGQVVHKAYVNVDESGTEAAAATGVIMELTAVMPEPPVTMIVDRPFLFLIREVQHGTLLFVGQVVRP